MGQIKNAREEKRAGRVRLSMPVPDLRPHVQSKVATALQDHIEPVQAGLRGPLELNLSQTRQKINTHKQWVVVGVYAWQQRVWGHGTQNAQRNLHSAARAAPAPLKRAPGSSRASKQSTPLPAPPQEDTTTPLETPGRTEHAPWQPGSEQQGPSNADGAVSIRRSQRRD